MRFAFAVPLLPFLSPVAYLKFSPTPDVRDAAPGSPLQGCCSQTRRVANSKGIERPDGNVDWDSRGLIWQGMVGPVGPGESAPQLKSFRCKLFKSAVC